MKILFIQVVIFLLLNTSCLPRVSDRKIDRPVSNDAKDDPKQPQPSPDHVDFGQESQNGDWSFAERARILFNEAFDHLIWTLTLKEPNYSDFDLSELSIAHKQELVDQLVKFRKTLIIPSNPQLFKQTLSNTFFNKKDGQLSLQIDYFVKYGVHVNPLERIYLIFSTQHLILTQFAEGKNFNQQKANQFAEYIHHHFIWKLQEDFAKEIAQTQPQQISLESIRSFAEMRLSYSLMNEILMQKNKEKLQFDQLQIKPLQQIVWNPKILGNCKKDEEPQCSKGLNDFFINIGSVKLELLQNSNIVKSFDFFHDNSYNIMNSTTSHNTYIDARQGNITTDSIVWKKIAPLRIKWDEEFIIAKNMLNEARNELIHELKQISLTRLQTIIEKNGGQYKPEINIVNTISAMPPLTTESIQQAPKSIKNFNYDSSKKIIFAEPTFFLSFNKYSSVFEKFNIINEIKGLMLHEVAHLYDMNEDQSKRFRSEMNHEIIEKTTSFGDQPLLVINAAQPSQNELENKLKTNIETFLKTHVTKMSQLLLSKGFASDAKQFTYKSIRKQEICHMSATSTPCVRKYISHHTIEWIEITLPLKNSQEFLTYKIHLQYAMKIENYIGNIGRLYASLSAGELPEENDISNGKGNYTAIKNQKSEEVLRLYRYTDVKKVIFDPQIDDLFKVDSKIFQIDL